MKTFITLLLLSLICRGNPHYVMDAESIPFMQGTFFLREDGHIFCIEGEHYYGDVVLVMDSRGTDGVTDDIITAVINR